jgi:murein DD-endopeptidase MepM/ murein hydrolase activator NlpD
MSKGRVYYYDEGQCTFVELKKSRMALVRRVFVTLVAAVFLAGAAYWGLGDVLGSPEVVALEIENQELRSRLSETEDRIESIRDELESLAQIDQELYRTILQAEPISDEVRQAGTGGTDKYEEFQRFGPDTRAVLRSATENLDRLEREVDLQSSSYRELVELARARSEELKQLPAIMPADGRLVSGFGMRMHPIDHVRKMHYGIDITVPKGTPVVATADGVVKYTGRKGGYGITVEVRHSDSGYITRYTHLSRIPKSTRRGRRVKRGDVIAFSGNTGRSTAPHVHYEILDLSGRQVNPIDFFAPGMTPSEYERLRSDAERDVASLD